MPRSHYVRQLHVKIRGPGDQAIVDDAARHLGKWAARKGIEAVEAVLDPAVKENARIVVGNNLIEGLRFVSEAEPSRIYIIAHGSRSATLTLAGLNAAEIVSVLLSAGKLRAKRIALVACFGGADNSMGVSETLPQQICMLLAKRRIYSEVAGYSHAISVTTDAYEAKQNEGRDQPLQLTGRKAFHDKDDVRWVAPNRAATKRVYQYRDGELTQSFE